MFSCCFDGPDCQVGDSPDVVGPERKSALAAIRVGVCVAGREWVGGRVRLSLFEDGCLLLTAFGDCPVSAAVEARGLLARNRRRFA